MADVAVGLGLRRPMRWFALGSFALAGLTLLLQLGWALALALEAKVSWFSPVGVVVAGVTAVVCPFAWRNVNAVAASERRRRFTKQVSDLRER